MINKLEKIPQCVKHVIGNPPATMLIKGFAGTGKTVFTLDALSAKEQTVLYISTRVSIKKLKAEIPWLDSEFSGKLIDGRKVGMRISFDKTSIFFEIMNEPEFVKKIYNLLMDVQEKSQKPIIVIIDSIDALKADLDIPPSDIRLEKKLIEISELTKSTIVFVTEQLEKQAIDFLVDAIISLEKKVIDGRIIRLLKVDKVRGASIEAPVYPFSLHNAHFRYFAPLNFVHYHILNFGPTVPISINEKIPTRIKELDRILLGGYPIHSINLIELGKNIGNSFALLLKPIITNFLLQNKKVFMLPSPRFSYSEIKKVYQKNLPEKYFKNLRLIEITSPRRENSDNIVILSTEDAAKDLRRLEKSIVKSNESEIEPFLLILSADMLNSVYDYKELEIWIRELIRFSREYPGIVIILTSSNLKILNFIKTIATTHFKLENYFGTLLLAGEVPFTKYYAPILEEKEDKSFEIKLYPIV